MAFRDVADLWPQVGHARGEALVWPGGKVVPGDGDAAPAAGFAEDVGSDSGGFALYVVDGGEGVLIADAEGGCGGCGHPGMEAIPDQRDGDEHNDAAAPNC